MSIARNAARPVVIADTQDKTGAGGSGDTTGLLEALVRNQGKARCWAFFDAEAATAAQRLARRGTSDRAGRQYGPEGVKPYSATFRVVRLRDGRMRNHGPSVGGRNIDLGRLRCCVSTVSASSSAASACRRTIRRPFRHLVYRAEGPEDPRAQEHGAFQGRLSAARGGGPVAVAPGGHIVDPTKYPYRRLRAGVRLYPLGPDFAGAASAP